MSDGSDQKTWAHLLDPVLQERPAHRGSADSDKYETARDLLRDREGDISKGIPITARPTRFTFDEAVKDVITDYGVNGKRSKDNVDRRIKLHLTPYFGGRRLSSITTADARAFASSRLTANA